MDNQMRLQLAGITWVPVGELLDELEKVETITKERDEWKHKAEVNRASHDAHLKDSARQINDLRKELDGWRNDADRFYQEKNNLAASISELERILSHQRASKVNLIRENDRLRADLDALQASSHSFKRELAMRCALERNFEVTAAAKEYWKSEARGSQVSEALQVSRAEYWHREWKKASGYE